MSWVPGLAVRILTHERARSGKQSVIDALLDVVRRHALAGMTVSRAVEGWSAHGALRSSGVLELGDDLPLIVEIVDRADIMEPVLPEIASHITSGVLLVSETRLFLPDIPESQKQHHRLPRLLRGHPVEGE